MEVTYQITEDHYTKIIKYQMKHAQKALPRVIMSIVINGVFGFFAIYFLLMATHHSWPIRMVPVILFISTIALTLHKRLIIEKQAKKKLEHLLETGTLASDFIGEHKLSLQSGKVTLKYGHANYEIDYNDIDRIEMFENIMLMFVKGVIFEMIPNDVLDFETNRRFISSKLEKSLLEKALERKMKQKSGISQ